MNYKLSIAVLLLPLQLLAQEPKETFNPIPVASPILIVSPDSRASGMGDIGVATSPDASSQHWNAAKYAFIEDKIGGSLSYIPWLRGLVNDVNITYLSVFYKLSEKQAIATSLRYFSLGDMSIIDDHGQTITETSPYEMAFDLSWTRQFGENFSFALTGRYIRSDLTGGVTGNALGGGDYNAMVPANAWSFDFGAYYQKGSMRDGEYALGLCLSNLGSKITYKQEGKNKYFLPMGMRIGGRYGFAVDGDNDLSFSLELNKLLVPTPPVRDENDEVIKGMDDDVTKISVPIAIFQSFYDAPYGFKEELSEITMGFGAEYGYRRTFFGRTGFFYDSKRKGNRRYLTFGAGLRYGFIALDLAYYASFTNNDPMANTLKFTLGFTFSRIGTSSPRMYN